MNKKIRRDARGPQGVSNAKAAGTAILALVVWLIVWQRPSARQFSEIIPGPLAGWAVALAARAREMLPPLNEESPAWFMGAPAVLMIAAAVFLRLSFPRVPNALRFPVALLFLAAQSSFLGFRAVHTLTFANALDGTVSTLFFISELFIHLRIALGNFALLHITDRSPMADESQRAVRAGEYLPSVDIFVPTYSESVSMLRRTLIGCQAMDYPNKTIYLLDDQRRRAMRELAAELGCGYLDRPDNRHAKAGNLNHALPLTKGQLIVCFDADFVPCRDFLERTVGFFRESGVGMVQTPQNFFNEDAVTRNLGLDRCLEDEQRLFFRAIQPGRDSRNAIICHGSCFIVRRSALEEIGGVPTETITEDWATSIKLQAAGYKLYYLNEALSAGMSADKSGEFLQQRSRWAQGTLQALFATTNPLKVPGLNWRQRLIHFNGIIYYLGSLSNLFNLVAPLFFLFFGVHLLRMTVAEMVFYRIPFMVGFYLLYSWLNGGMRSALWTEFYEVFVAPVMCLTVLRTLIKPFGTGFRVTDKSIRRGRLSINRRVAMPFVILLALHIAGVVLAFWMQRQMEEPEAFWIALYFSAANIVMLWVCVLVSIDVAQQTPWIRFAHRLPCTLTWEDTGISGHTVSVSEGDFTFEADRAADVPADAYLHCPTLRMFDVPVRLAAANSTGLLTFEFGNLALEQYRVLVEFLFCQPGQWQRPPRSEARAAWEYFRAPLRMYSLAESP